jgi:hypothetical protein
MTHSNGPVPATALAKALCLFVFFVLTLECANLSTAGADRIVLAPRGSIRGPGEISGELAISTKTAKNYMGWVAGGLPGDLGIELEAERFELGGVRRETLSAQYLLIPEGLTNNIAPTISLGVRDIPNRGMEGRAFFAAATKTIGLSKKQEALIQDLKLHGGYGTNRLGGLYVGLEGRFSPGFIAAAEYVSHRVNASITVPVGRYANLRAYSLDGDAFYGGGFKMRL